MRPTSRIHRSIAGFHRISPLVMGLSLGLVSSASADNFEHPATVSVDRMLHIGDVPTGAVCSGGLVRCFAHVHATDSGHVKAYAAPQGFGPADIQAAYNIDPASVVPSTAPTVAVIDAYGYPSLESDLAAYRSQFGLPACTSASGCLKIVNQNGQASPLPGNAPAGDDWTIETALDVDMVSAACPTCKIVVVQATDDQGDGLFVANNVPSTLGATVVSNSWGGPEQPGGGLGQYETYFNHAGVAVFVSAGDAGYDDGGQGPDYPATSQYAIAVGGTNLSRDGSSRGWTETAWTSGGSACSLSIAKPGYQTGTMCQYKATTDVAAVADPQTGVAVYNNGGWTVVGGTSAASPLVAAIWAATGNGAQTSGAYVMQHASIFNDVTSGSNGNCGNILCNAGAGWDGPTGYGTPNAGMLAALNVPAGTGSGSGSGSGTGSGDGSGGQGGGSATDGQQVVLGGCSAGGSGAGLGLVLALGFVAARRRRR